MLCCVCVGNINNDGFQQWPMTEKTIRTLDTGHWMLDIEKPTSKNPMYMEFLSVKKKEQFQENKTYKENENKRLIQLGHQSVYKPIIVICNIFCFGFCNRNEKKIIYHTSENIQPSNQKQQKTMWPFYHHHHHLRKTNWPLIFEDELMHRGNTVFEFWVSSESNCIKSSSNINDMGETDIIIIKCIIKVFPIFVFLGCKNIFLCFLEQEN